MRPAMLLLGLLMLLPPRASAHGLFSAAGSWSGWYNCAQGATALELDISVTAPKQVSALFYFHATPDNPHVPPGCFLMQGGFNMMTGALNLHPVQWQLHPPGFVPVGLAGQINKNGELLGQIFGPGCTSFALTRQAAPQTPPGCTPPLQLGTT